MQPLHTTSAASNPMTSSWPFRESPISITFISNFFLLFTKLRIWTQVNCCFTAAWCDFFIFSTTLNFKIVDISNTSLSNSDVVIKFKHSIIEVFLIVIICCWQVWSQTCSAATQSLWCPGNHPHLCCRFPVQVPILWHRLSDSHVFQMCCLNNHSFIAGQFYGKGRRSENSKASCLSVRIVYFRLKDQCVFYTFTTKHF